LEWAKPIRPTTNNPAHSLLIVGWVISSGLNGLGPFQLIKSLDFGYVYIRPNSLMVGNIELVNSKLWIGGRALNSSRDRTSQIVHFYPFVPFNTNPLPIQLFMNSFNQFIILFYFHLNFHYNFINQTLEIHNRFRICYTIVPRIFILFNHHHRRKPLHPYLQKSNVKT
jgi:hypothetical protein